MTLIDLLVVPFLLGLVGSIEPCSIGINSIFLGHVNKFEKHRRIFEAFKFTLVRALVMALVGLSVAFIGARFFTFQSYYNVVLGFFYIFLGIALIVSRFRPLPIPKIELPNIIKRGFGAENNKTLAMGVTFGFAIPVCAVPLIAALMGKSLLSGDLFFGFVSFFIFGIALSSPLLPLSYSERGHDILRKIARRSYLAYYIGGAALIALGAFTIVNWIYVFPQYFPN
ncbi:MAG: cytochrome c biogenesis protein CcdA [Candidatus Hydrothermarchaeaceae archaeon]